MNLIEALRAPLWPLEIFSARKNFVGNPILSSERLNRRGLHVFRARLAADLAARRRARLARLVSAEDRAAFERDGFVAKPGFLTEADFAALAREVMALEAKATEFREGDAVTRQIPVTPAVLARAPALRRFVESPEYQGLVRYVGSFDKAPRIFIQTIFSRTASAETDPQTALHVDTFHPTVKAWFFLEDVGEEDGPFSYVPGSHRLTPRRLAWQKRRSVLACRPGAGSRGGAFRFTPADLRRLRLPPPRRFAVSRNTLVVGDTCGIHARTPTVRANRRVEIWATSRPNPFWPFAGHPWWTIPGIWARESAAYLWLKTAVQRSGLVRFKTLVVGEVTPLEEPRIAGAPATGAPRG